jgi:immune inhibitor A
MPSFPEWFGKGLEKAQSASGEGRAVTFLIEFPDRLADVGQRPASAYHNLFFSQGIIPTGSLRDIYLEQSYGTYSLTGDTHGWLRTTDDYATNYDDGLFGLAGGGNKVTKAAVDLTDPSIDFGVYDSDGPDGIPSSGDDDGYVDACFVVYSGAGGHDTGDPSDIWAHATGFERNYLTNDPSAGGGFIRVDGYTMQPEVGVHLNGDSVLLGLGVPAHEYGHVLGLPDLYDGSRDTWGLGYWCLMSYGASLLRGTEVHSPVHMSAWCKEQLGWVSPIVVTGNLWDIVIPPVETNPVVYKVWRDGAPGDEYFLLENRQNLGFDDILPGKGLLIWHIDHTSTPRLDLVDLEEADGKDDLEQGTGSRPGGGVYHPELGDAGDPYPGDSLNTIFDETSYPASTDNGGSPTDVSVEEIQLDGNNVRLNIIFDPTIVGVPAGDIQITLGLSQNYPNPFNPSTVVEYTLPKSVVVNVSIYDTSGKRIVTLEEGLRPAGLSRLRWDGRDARGNLVSSGVYFCRLKAGDRLVARKMVLLK